MRLIFTKTSRHIVDTAKERKRINEIFKGAERNHLNKFMDLFERGDMKGAYKEIESKWWKGCSKNGDHRLEYIGLADWVSGTSFADLVYACVLNKKQWEWRHE